MVANGDSIRQTFELGTRSKPLAKRKPARLVAKPETEPAAQAHQQATSPETVDQYAGSYLAGRQARGVRTVADERYWLATCWSPAAS